MLNISKKPQYKIQTSFFIVHNYEVIKKKKLVSLVYRKTPYQK